MRPTKTKRTQKSERARHAFAPRTAHVLCARIAQGESLASICADDDSKPKMPPMLTVIYWLADNPQFRADYARAREILADVMVDEIRSIADEEADGAKARLKVESRKWLAARLAPTRYGDRPARDAATDRPKIIRVVTGVPEAGDP